ncbi:hypothetical protein OH799_19650 [Nocardia sp. NBC_00881]|uniref:hypothetical protein n=1 Tax=Nocardia sp. NBC_00881 TaxID=2975995 RepID=UPI003868516F|nr:hypothetical protein OH799_19650 [Nocardia sp. NBC_00881]
MRRFGNRLGDNAIQHHMPDLPGLTQAGAAAVLDCYEAWHSPPRATIHEVTKMAAGASPVQRQDHSLDHPELDVLPEWPLETIGVLVTTDPAPHAIPVSWPVRAGDRQILISLKYDRGSLARLRERPDVAVLILGGGNVAMCARGTAHVVAEEMPDAADYVAVRIDVEVIDDHRQSAFAVAQGIQRTVLDDESELRALKGRVTTLQSWIDSKN